MSIKIMSSVWERSSQKGSRLLLLLAIADFAREDGIAWPGIKTLADMSRMSERQTVRNIRDLVKAGELEVVKSGGSGPRDTSMYRVIVRPNKGDKLSETTPKKGDMLTPSDLPKGDTHVTLKGDISGPKGDIAMSPEPLIEPSLEPSSIPPDGGHPESQLRNNETEPGPAQEQPFQMLERVMEVQGVGMEVWTRQQLGRQLSVAKRLIGDGVTIAEVESCCRWIVGQQWASSVDMFLIEKKLGDHRIATQRKSNQHPGTTRRGMSAEQALGKYYRKESK